MITTTRPVASSSLSASDEKVHANRSNALKSTGPKSDAGKASSSQNARKHGIFCRDLLGPEEDPVALDMFKRGMIRSLNPCNEMQLQLVEQIIADEWRIKRIRSAEQSAFRRLQNADKAVFDKNLAKVREEREQMEYSIARASKPDSKYSQRYPQFREEYLRQSAEWAKLRDADPVFVPSNAGQLMDRMVNESDELERLSKYEQRLRGSIMRALKQFKELKAQDREDPSEFAAIAMEHQTEVPPDDQPTPSILQNEATNSASAEMAMPSAPDDATTELVERVKELKQTMTAQLKLEKLIHEASAED